MKKLLAAAVLAVSIIAFSSTAFASTGASLWYYETDLGSGLWQYDYTFQNMSTAGESLFTVNLFFTQMADVTNLQLPSGWASAAPSTTDLLDTFSTDPSYEIAAGSFLNGFSFTTNYRAGNIAYDAYFDDGTGNGILSSGITAIAPEPVSMVLFIAGSAVVGGRLCCKRMKKA